MTKFSSFPFNGLSANLELTHRPRRNRKADWARRLVRETTVTVDDLIWPLFVREGSGIVEPIASMPGVSRMSVDEVVKAARIAADAGIPVIALFPYTNPALRDEQGSEALGVGRSRRSHGPAAHGGGHGRPRVPRWPAGAWPSCGRLAACGHSDHPADP
jgi:hypothetical protein